MGKKKFSKEELLNDKSSHMGDRFLFAFGALFLVASFIFLMYLSTAFLIVAAIGVVMLIKGKHGYDMFLEREKLKTKMYETPVSAKIVSSGESKKAGSAALRSAVGGSIAGLPGAVYGVASAKSKTSVTFYVTYEDGHHGSETVNSDSSRFLKLMKVCKD